MTKRDYDVLQALIDRRLEAYKRSSVCTKYQEAVKDFTLSLKSAIHRQFNTDQEKGDDDEA